MLPPLGKTAEGRKHFGVSATHNYLFSLVIAFETAAIAGLHQPKPASVAAVFVVAWAAAIMAAAILRWFLEAKGTTAHLRGELATESPPGSNAGATPDPPAPKRSGG
jgi:hypothetical protein